MNGYKFIPNKYWIVGIRSNADLPDKFDDAFYLFNNDKAYYINYRYYQSRNLFHNPVNRLGTVVIKTNEWNYDVVSVDCIEVRCQHLDK